MKNCEKPAKSRMYKKENDAVSATAVCDPFWSCGARVFQGLKSFMSSVQSSWHELMGMAVSLPVINHSSEVDNHAMSDNFLSF